MIVVNVIILAINLVVLGVVWYRVGRQRAYDDIVNAYKYVCQDNERLWSVVRTLKDRLANSCDGKEASDD